MEYVRLVTLGAYNPKHTTDAWKGKEVTITSYTTDAAALGQLSRLLMKILLDIDGVLVTVPSWRPVNLLADGFMKFNAHAAKNLARIIDQTKASIILTTTHRINYSIEEWKIVLQTRGIYPSAIEKVNDIKDLSLMPSRAVEIQEWIDRKDTANFVIIDDDLSVNSLPALIKKRLVLTRPMIGLDDEAADKAIEILLKSGDSA